MGTNNSGYEYEKKILKILNILEISGDIKNHTGNHASACDADFKIHGKVYNLEVKLDTNAQMGGSSVRYNLLDDTFSFRDKIELDVQEILLHELETKKPEILKLINFISEREPAYNKRIPIICTRDTWSMAKKEKLLFNTRIPFNTDFITTHYKKKNVFYIQIGGAGLFYLHDNPANLPIPQLKGKIDIEIRTGRSGARYKILDNTIISGGLRIQSRLKTKNKSPHTIDTIKGVQKLLEAIKHNCYVCSDDKFNLVPSTKEDLKSSTVFVKCQLY